MSFDIVEKNQVLREITVTVPAGMVADREAELVSKARKSVTIRGFRKGKVPASVIRQHMGAGILEDARRESIEKCANEALTSVAGLIYAGELTVVSPKNENGDIVVKFDAEIEPSIKELGNYKGLEVTVADAVVSDADIDARIEQIRADNASINHTDRRIAAKGDFITLDLGELGDDAKAVLFTGGKRQFILGEGKLNEKIEAQLEGAEMDKELELKAGPDDAEITVRGTIVEIKERVLPAVDDDLAKDTGEADTLDELKAKIREELQKTADSKRDDEIDTGLLVRLRELNAIDIPMGFVRGRAKQAAKVRFEQMTGRQIADNVLERLFANYTEDQLREYIDGYHDEIVLSAIAKAENIEVTDDEVVKEAKEMFNNPDMGDADITRWLKSNGAWGYMRETVIRDRALDVVKAAAVVKSAE